MLLACFCFALLILASTIGAVFVKIRHFTQSVRVMLIGIVGIITVLIFPMYRDSYDDATSLLFSLLYALRSLSGCQSVDVSHRVLIEGWLYYAYYALLYLAFITAPVFTTSFLISIFGNLNDKFRYVFLGCSELHVFSKLNESSIHLCESLNDGKKRFVFCNTKLSGNDKDTVLVQRARAAGAIILDYSELVLRINKKKIRFYQVSDSKDYNINTTIALIEKYRGQENLDVRIAAFSTGVTSELLLDSVDKGNIRVKLIDEVKYSCYSLLDQSPLFSGAIGDKISALIVGCDYTGTEMLKAIIWCGQLTGYKLEINIVDKNADILEKRFRKSCPDIDFGMYGISFLKADVNTSDFENILNSCCSDTTYVVVMTGDDKLNIDTAVYLRKYFLRRDKKYFHNRPRINLRVRDGLKNKQMDALVDANIEAYALFAFGSLEKTFNIRNLMSSPLEKMAIGVHLAYSGALNGTDEQRHEAMKEYYIKEYNQRSSFATALHIKYKLFASGIKGVGAGKVNEEQIDEFEKLLLDPDKLESLAELEHERWNAFMRTEGYSLASPEDVAVYRNMGKSPTHIHYLAKLHPSLVAWDELDDISSKVSEIMNSHIDFKQNDYDIVRRIPDILRAQNSNLTYWGD